MSKCKGPDCGAPLPAKGRFCKKCGFDNAPVATVKCEECNKANPEGYKFCKSCGAPPADAQTKPKAESQPKVEPKTTESKKVAKKACSNCGKPNAPGYGQCSCGEPEPGAGKGNADNAKEASPPKKAAAGKKEMVLCGQCGKENAAGYRFCKKCGSPPASTDAASTGGAKAAPDNVTSKKTEKKASGSDSSAPQVKEENKAATVVEEDACIDCNTILSSAAARYCLNCGLRQPTVQPLKLKARRGANQDATVNFDDLLERLDLKLEELLEKSKAKKDQASKQEKGGDVGSGANAEEVEKLKAEVAKWKGLFQAAAADVDEKDEILAAQMQQIEELTAQLEGK